jgi:predicted N-acetyltransferase YhbS
MSEAAAANITIRPACAFELPLMQQIEIDAFATLAQALGVDRDAHALPLDVLRQSLREDCLFVAVDDTDRPIAFLAGTEIDRMFYVIELDVVTAWQRRGIGRRLMLTAIEAARAMDLVGVTLTTDRHVAFNAPFYQSLGLDLLDGDRTLPFLQKKLDEEIGNGMDPLRRVAMALWFAPSKQT